MMHFINWSIFTIDGGERKNLEMEMEMEMEMEL